MRAYLAIKYYSDLKNKELIENITETLKAIGIDAFVFARDIENYQISNLTPEELMKRAFEEIEKSDLLIIEASEQSIGIGIEAGYAYTKKIPVYLIAKKDTYVSGSIKGISKKCVFYENMDDLLKLKED